MAFKPLTYMGRAFGWFWSVLDSTRRLVFNLLFLLIVVVILAAMFSGGLKPIGPKSALVLELRGDLVEQHSGTVRDTLLQNIGGESPKSVQLRDVLTVLDAAARDDNISSVLLTLDDLDSAGLAMLHEVGAAIERVKAAGKPVIAWGGSYDQRQYMLASYASQIYMHPMGYALVEGFGGYRNYYRDALDKLGVTVNLIKVGTYKSAAEPFVSNGPSEAARAADAFLYNGLWETYTNNIEKNRKMPAGTMMKNINELPGMMARVNGDTGKLALATKMVDGLKTRDEMRDMMIKIGAEDLEGKTFRQVGFENYLLRHGPQLFGDGIGVIVAAGEISDGVAPPGAIGGLSTANLIRKAREDEQIKAIVLRVDSPGGSPYGSELIRRELELARAQGKPVVVSMGNVAASGGYWISMSADEVIADRSTITGSIGVFALLPTAEKAIDKLGIHSAGVTTTWLADVYSPLRAIDPRFGQLVQSSINHIYDDFTSKAAKARNTTQAKIDEVGQGRVWTGAQAKERGLVDTIGSFGDALNSAARRAKLADGYRIAYIERDISPFERALTLLGASSAQVLAIEVKLGLMPALPAGVVAQAGKELAWLADLTERRNPFAAVTHCMCGTP